MNQVFTSKTISDLHRQIESFMKDHDVYDYDNVTIVTERVKDETPAGYHWKATLMPTDAASAMKELLVDEHEYINHFWCWDDIRGLETGGREFTEDEVADIASRVESMVDCNYGINWDFIDQIAQEVAPEAYEEFTDEDEEG